MEFTLHNSYVILEPVPSTMTYWTGLICWRKSCTNKATLLQDWIHRYKNNRVVIRIMLTITKCASQKGNGSFTFYRFFLSSITDKTFIGLNYIYIWVIQQCLIRSRNCLHFVNTWFTPGFWFVLFIFLIFCVVFLCFVCLHSVSCVFNVDSVSGLSLWFTLTLFVFILRLVCSMLPVSLECPFDLH